MIYLAAIIGLAVVALYVYFALRPAQPRSQGLCETTLTERFDVDGCRCVTYEGNLGPCLTWCDNGRGACVYCDHGLECHRTLSATRARPHAG